MGEWGEEDGARGRWAVKEAAFKAMAARRALTWKEVVLGRARDAPAQGRGSGPPQATLALARRADGEDGHGDGHADLLVSVSHDGEYTVAAVIAVAPF